MMKALGKLLVTGITFVSISAMATNAKNDHTSFKQQIMESQGGEWGGSYNAKYFAATPQNGKLVFKYSDNEVNQAWPNPGQAGPMLDVMNIQFFMNEGLLGYVYERDLLEDVVAGAETDEQVCQVADPKNPAENGVIVRPRGTALPRTVVFKGDAMAGALAKARAAVEQAVDAKIAAGELPAGARDQAIASQMPAAQAQASAKVEEQFSKENFSNKLYVDVDPRQNPKLASINPQYRKSLAIGDEVIGVIKGKRCAIKNAGDAWGKLVDLNVPVIRAEIVDGVLQMRAIIGPSVQGGKVYQGYSIYKQTPGAKSSLKEIAFELRAVGQQ